MTNAYLTQKITDLKARIDAAEAAQLAIASGATEEYRLDTGQTVTTVTKINLQTLQNVIDGMYNQLTVMCARLNGGGTVTVGPNW